MASLVSVAASSSARTTALEVRASAPCICTARARTVARALGFIRYRMVASPATTSLCFHTSTTSTRATAVSSSYPAAVSIASLHHHFWPFNFCSTYLNRSMCGLGRADKSLFERPPELYGTFGEAARYVLIQHNTTHQTTRPLGHLKHLYHDACQCQCDGSLAVQSLLN